MKIIDCFNYFEEDLILEIRLATLFNYVDKFVICEATLDHAGNEKKLNFDISKFKKYAEKIEYIVIDDLPKIVTKFKKHWHTAHARDQFQRNALIRGLSKCDPNDLIMISDLDEIPNPEKISNFKEEDRYVCFEQKNFLLKFNLLNITELSHIIVLYFEYLIIHMLIIFCKDFPSLFLSIRLSHKKLFISFSPLMFFCFIQKIFGSISLILNEFFL